MKRVILVTMLVLLLAGCESATEEAPVVEQGLVNGEFTAEINGHPMRYAVHGDGPPCIVLTNAWGLTYDALHRLLGPLEEHLTMVYFDTRGMGGSGPVVEETDLSLAAVREDADALREYLGLETAHFLGWSNGGMNLMLFAAEYPDTVDSAIIVHSPAYMSEEDYQALMESNPDLFQEFVAFQQEMAASEAEESEKNDRLKEFCLNRWFPATFVDDAREQEVLWATFGTAGWSLRHMNYQDRVENPKFDARGELGKITAPTLVIAGAHDLMPMSRMDEVAAGIPDATLVVFENSGHFAPLEETELFVTTVVEFLGL